MQVCGCCGSKRNNYASSCEVCDKNFKLLDSGLLNEIYKNRQDLITISLEKIWFLQKIGKFYLTVIITVCIFLLLDIPNGIGYRLIGAISISFIIHLLFILFFNNLINSISLFLIKLIHGYDPFLEEKRIRNTIDEKFKVNDLISFESANILNNKILMEIKAIK